MPIVQRCYCTRIRSNTMTSMFDYDDSVNLAFDAKIAGKKVVAAKHELLSKTGDFFFMAHSERELAQRMQMVEEDIEKVAYHKLSNVSDSKAKLVRAVLDEWQLRHASCSMCKTANPDWKPNPNRKLPQNWPVHEHGEPKPHPDWKPNPNRKLPQNWPVNEHGEHDTSKVHPDWNPDPHRTEPDKPKWNPEPHRKPEPPTKKPTPPSPWEGDPHRTEPDKPKWNPEPHRTEPENPHSRMSTCPSCGTRGPNATGAYGTCPDCDLGRNPRNPDYGRKDPHGNPVPGSDYPFISRPHINPSGDKNINPSGDKKDDYLK